MNGAKCTENSAATGEMDLWCGEEFIDSGNGGETYDIFAKGLILGTVESRNEAEFADFARLTNIAMILKGR